MDVAICLKVKDEHRYRPEWFAHYRGLGVTHFLVYENGTAEPMQPQQNVSVRLWPYSFSREQCVAYLHACRMNPQFEWIGFFDLDEFLILRRHSTVQELLAEHGTADALAINWLCYGDSGLQEPPTSHQAYIKHGAPELPINRHVKCFVRPGAVQRAPQDPHYFHVPTVNLRGEPVSNAFSPHDSSIAFLKHTITRTKTEFMEKVLRGGGNGAKHYPEEAFADFQSYLNTHETKV